MVWTSPFFSLVEQLPRAATFMAPADLTVSDGDFVLTMDVPGVKADDLSIELADGYLVVRGVRQRPELGDGSQWAHAERTFGTFERRVKVPDGVDPDAIMANLDDGVLSLIVPKPERLKPRTIAIGSGAGQRELETTTA